MFSISNKEDVKKKSSGSNCACILVMIMIVLISMDLFWINYLPSFPELNYIISLLDALKWIIVVAILIIILVRNSD